MDEEVKSDKIKKGTTNSPVEKSGFNITSMILGIISVVNFYSWPVAVPSAIVAIIFSIAGKCDSNKELGSAGLTLGIISLAFQLLVLVLRQVGISA